MERECGMRARFQLPGCCQDRRARGEEQRDVGNPTSSYLKKTETHHASTLTPMVSTSNHEEQTPASNKPRHECDIYALGAGLHPLITLTKVLIAFNGKKRSWGPINQYSHRWHHHPSQSQSSERETKIATAFIAIFISPAPVGHK